MAVGEVDVDALLARLTSWQISEWMAFYAIEPFGEQRADLRAAIVAMVMANATRDEKKRREPFSIDDFMPKFDQESKPAQTWQQQKALMMALTKR